MEPQEVKTTPPWMGCQSNARLPPSISSGFPDSFTVPICTPERRETISILILLGEEKYCESKVSCQGTQHIDPARSGNQTSYHRFQHTDPPPSQCYHIFDWQPLTHKLRFTNFSNISLHLSSQETVSPYPDTLTN